MIATLNRTTGGFATAHKRYFDVWGAVEHESGLGTNPPSQKYCANLGHVQDDESDLIYMRARYYEPWTGRFVSEDKALDGLNWYSYANNDPVGLVDQRGTEAGPLKYYYDVIRFIFGSQMSQFSFDRVTIILERSIETFELKAKTHLANAVSFEQEALAAALAGAKNMSDALRATAARHRAISVTYSLGALQIRMLLFIHKLNLFE